VDAEELELFKREVEYDPDAHRATRITAEPNRWMGKNEKARA